MRCHVTLPCLALLYVDLFMLFNLICHFSLFIFCCSNYIYVVMLRLVALQIAPLSVVYSNRSSSVS